MFPRTQEFYFKKGHVDITAETTLANSQITDYLNQPVFFLSLHKISWPKPIDHYSWSLLLATELFMVTVSCLTYYALMA